MSTRLYKTVAQYSAPIPYLQESHHMRRAHRAELLGETVQPTQRYWERSSRASVTIYKHKFFVDWGAA
jgi:hypothetical protein